MQKNFFYIKLSFLFLAILPGIFVSAQTVGQAITLKVYDSLSREPVSDAEIITPFFKQTTNAGGKAVFYKYPKSGFHLQINHISYLPYDGHLFVEEEQAIYKIPLSPKRDSLETVRVTGFSAEGKNNTSTVAVLSAQELEKTKSNSLAGILQGVPGVSMIQTGATIAKPVINGMHSNRILIINNGVKQEGQQWGAEHAPEVDPNIAKNIVVVKGADAVRYGTEAIGGVILINPPLLSYGDAIHGEVDLVGTGNGRLFGGNLMLNGSLRNQPGFAWRIQGSGKKSGNFKTADYFLNNTGTNELNFSAAAGIRKKRFSAEVFGSIFSMETGIFNGAHIGDTSDLFARIRNEVPFEKGAFSYYITAPKQRVFHQLYKVKASYRFNDESVLQVQYSFQNNKRKEYDMRRAGREAVPSLHLDLNAQNMDIYWEKKYASAWKTHVGINGFYKTNVNVPGTGVTPLIPNYVNMGSGIYAIQKFTRQKFELEAGLRYDYQFLNAIGSRSFYKYVNDKGEEIPATRPGGEYIKVENLYGGEKTFSNLSAIIGTLFKLSPEWRISSNLGLAWRAPQVSELYSYGLHHGSASVEHGDSLLVGEKSYKWISTVYHQGKKLSFEVSGFAQLINGYIYLKPTTQFEQSIRGAFPVFRYLQTNAFFGGADLSVRYRFCKSFAYEVKGSLVRAKNISSAKKYLPMIPSDRISNTATWELKDGKLFRSNYLQLEWQYVARQNHYEPGSDFAPPPPAYNLFNFSAGTYVPLKYNGFHLNLTVSNLMNTLYKDYLNRFRYYSHDIGRNLQLSVIYKF